VGIFGEYPLARLKWNLPDRVRAIELRSARFGKVCRKHVLYKNAHKILTFQPTSN